MTAINTDFHPRAFHSSSKVHVLIPAFNESDNIFDVVSELSQLQRDGKAIINNVIVCSNASTDNTAELARKAGAIVVHESQQGYGAACLRAMRELSEINARPHDIIVFADGDHSVFASEVVDLIKRVRRAGGLVVGARTVQQMEAGAMSAHQRVGTLIASRMIQWIWGASVTDLGPLRALSYQDLLTLHMQDQSFGWTTEMQVKAIQYGMPYSELEVSTRKRRGHSKISGTVSGTIGAAYGIFSTIFWLWWQARGAELSDQLYR